MDQSLETITRRINALGLTEPTIAFTGRGDNEILVQLPGEGDPTRAKSVIQAGGQLELKLRGGRTDISFASAALAAHGGVLPAGTEIVPGKSESGRPASRQQQVYYILDRAPIVTGQDLAARLRSRAPTIPANTKLTFTFLLLLRRALVPLPKRTSATAWPSFSITRCTRRPMINGRIEDSGEIKEISLRSRRRIWRWCSGPGRCRLRSSISRSAPSARRSARIRFAKACALRSAASSS